MPPRLDGDDSMFDGKSYESISFTAKPSTNPLSRGGTHPIDRRSEESVLAVGQFLVLSRGQFCEVLLPKLLQYAIALPFFRWNARDQPIESSQRFAQALISLLVEV